jgi:hypothetical protein
MSQVETEIGMTHLQAKECLELSESEKGKEASLEVLETMVILTPCFQTFVL